MALILALCVEVGVEQFERGAQTSSQHSLVASRAMALPKHLSKLLHDTKFAKLTSRVQNHCFSAVVEVVSQNPDNSGCLRKHNMHSNEFPSPEHGDLQIDPAIFNLLENCLSCREEQVVLVSFEFLF